MWTMKNGTSISIDDMDVSHLRNSLRMLIKRHTQLLTHTNSLIDDYNRLLGKKNKEFVLNGDMAEQFNRSFDEDEYETDIY